MTTTGSIDAVTPGTPRQMVVMRASADSSVDSVLIPRTGLTFPRQLPFDRWLRIGNSLSAAHTSSAWCLGDWLIYGEGEYPGRYRDAIERTSLDYQTLRNYAWVSRQFPMLRRRETLSFGHHAEVASRPVSEQDFWLRKAEELGWSRNRLRREVRSSMDERTPIHEKRDQSECDAEAAPQGADLRQDSRTLRLETTGERFEHWGEKARSSGLSVEAWAMLTLDDASAS